MNKLLTLKKKVSSNRFYLGLGLFFCFFSTIVHANIEVQIEPSHIHMDQTFKLNLTQENPKYNSSIDLSPLKKDFTVVGSSRNEVYQQRQHTIRWTLFLKPRHEGILTIPSLKINGENTNPLTINVSPNVNTNPSPTSTKPNTANPADNPKSVFLTVDVSEKKPFINQQIIYTVKIYNAKQLLDATYEPPQVDNALVVPLPGKRYQTQKDNTPYLVEELSYAIFPQKSGPLTITPPTFIALIFDFQHQRIKTKNPPLTLNVSPIPNKNTAQNWLPAKDIQLNETYELEEKTLSQGSTLVRHITLKGVGVPAQLLPTLTFENTDALSVYPEKGKEQNQIVQGDIVGQTPMKITYLFNQSGAVTIPELKVTWFNTQTGREAITKLPPKTLNILATVGRIPPKAEEKSTEQISSPSPDNSTETMIPSSTPFSALWLWFTTILFAIAWGITLFLWRQQKCKPKSTPSVSKKNLSALQKACIDHNPQKARMALMQWASEQWPDWSFLNLNDLSNLIHDSSLRKQIQLLSQALYQEPAGEQWQGEALWASVQHFKKPLQTPQKNKEALPPLNPKI